MAGIQDFILPHLSKIRPYIPGKPIEQVRRELGVQGRIVKLASNENTAGTSPLAIEAIKAELDKLWLYPEDSVFYLRQALAAEHGVPAEGIVVGNGAVEVIYLLAEALMGPGDEAIMGDPAFMMYPITCQVQQSTAIQIPARDSKNDLQGMLDAITDRTKIIWLDNPNNPMGTYHSGTEIDEFVRAVDGRAVIVLDEAYQQFVNHPDPSDGTRYIREGLDNVVVLRTFSKVVGLAGVRCGYGLMSPVLAEALGKLRIKFSVNKLAQAATLAAMKDTEHIEKAQQLVWKGREFFYENCARLGIHCEPSQGNFVWLDFGRDARQLCQDLMHKGVIVRPGWIFGNTNCARVSISSEDDNRFFFDKLEELLG